MKGNSSRSKGRRGQAAFAALLAERDWTHVETAAGKATEDFLAIDPDGIAWAVEVKNTAAITQNHRAQAMQQALARKARWMLASHICGSSSWLIQRQGMRPAVWHSGRDDNTQINAAEGVR